MFFSMELPKGVPYHELLKQLVGSTIVRIEEPLDIYDTIHGVALRPTVRSIIGKTYDSDAEILVEGIARFLQGPVIVDRFLHHSERRKYVSSLSDIPELAVAQEAYQRNILRRNLIVSATTLTDMLIGNLDIDPHIRIITVSPSTKETLGMSRCRYDELNAEEKVSAVRQIQKGIFDAIKARM